MITYRQTRDENKRSRCQCDHHFRCFQIMPEARFERVDLFDPFKLLRLVVFDEFMRAEVDVFPLSTHVTYHSEHDQPRDKRKYDRQPYCLRRGHWDSHVVYGT